MVEVDAEPRTESPAVPRWLAIGVVSLAGLLLEVGYTRIVSYKLWYYYTYLVIGLALLGIGSGGVVVAVVRPLRRWSTDRVVGVFSTLGGLSIAAGYFVVARLPVDTRAIWDYGTGASFRNLALLGLICLVLFASFVALGVMVSVLLGRAGDDVGRLYFADLAGAGIACLVAIPLISRLGPPALVWLAALLFVAVGIPSLRVRWARVGAVVLAAVLVAGVVGRDGLLPDVKVEATKIGGEGALFSGWGPVFRVDVLDAGDDAVRLLAHDGTFGSGIHRFDGDTAAALAEYEHDPRATPFDILGDPPERTLIIGSAGGNEIVASLAFGAPFVEGVELNPVTVGLLENTFAEYTGNLTERPDVRITQGDGRTYLARSDTPYDLVWFVAPDSYAATNAASSGAFVLSESYLYTVEMIEETLRHLTDNGIMVVQFGELDLEGAPNRTSRYIVTAREALRRLGVDDPREHLLLSGYLTDETGDLSTIVLKRTPFTPEEVERFSTGLAAIPGSVALAGPGVTTSPLFVGQLAAAPEDALDGLVDSYPRDISAVTDDAPFFWHFSPFGDVVRDLDRPIFVSDPEVSIGERVLLLLVGFAAVYAAVFLLLPFALDRRRGGSTMPGAATAVAYFAALGLGFMLFEITMIQRLTRFLGFPTYSLTVTLASILVWTGLGALATGRLRAATAARAPLLALGALAVLTVLYQLGLDGLTDALQEQGLAVRVAVAFAVLAPLGFCLGMFMPLGLRVVGAAGGEAGDRYVAWAWAVNGFASVVGSVSTTMLSMTYGFRAVQWGAVVVYAFAVAALARLRRRTVAVA